MIMGSKFFNPYLYCTLIFPANPAIMAADEDGRVEIAQGSTAHLEVYVSGHPTPTASHVTWHRPGGSEVMASDQDVKFHESKRILVLSNVRPQQAGLYTCTVALSSLMSDMAVTEIFLEVYGEFADSGKLEKGDASH